MMACSRAKIRCARFNKFQFYKSHVYLSLFLFSSSYSKFNVSSKHADRKFEQRWVQRRFNPKSKNDILEENLFHTYWDLHCEVLSFVSLIGRTMYFLSRSLPIFEMWRSSQKKFKYVWSKTSYRYDALTNLPVRSARSFVFFFHLNSWIKIVRAHLAWDNLSIYVFIEII